MKRYVIERNIPGAGGFSPEKMRATAAKSNEALSGLAPGVQWQHTYVADDRMFCVYLAENEGGVRRHAEISGFPADRIFEVHQVIDPLTANGAR